MSHPAEYSQRQYQWMLRFIDYYREGSLHLNELVLKLEDLFDLVEPPSEQWAVEYKDRVGDLETINGMRFYYAELSQPDPNYGQDKVNELVDQLRNLVVDTLDSEDI